MKKPMQRFGGAVEGILEKVVSTAGSDISVADAGTREAFLDSWAGKLSDHASYLRSAGKMLAAPIVLAYVPDTGAFTKTHDWIIRRMLGVNFQDELSGVLAAGTSESGGCVHPQRFTDTGAIETAIRAAGLQAAPTIALMPQNKLFVWPDGIDSAEKPFERDLSGPAIVIDLDAIDQALTQFYEDVARQTKKWWHTASSRIVVNSPEGTVQYDLWVFLMAKYSHVARIKQEEKIGNGRSDITVVPLDTTCGNQSAVLELKTLRDVQTPTQAGTKLGKISQKSNIEWAASGLQQTAAYRDDNKMDVAFLCLYDFCATAGTEVMKVVSPAADALNVRARRYWITASHEEHRKERYPLPETQKN
ncbi:MAG: hypothetical protein KF796_14130 [Ramlibacter sp.]|nr:hypothetical protein [Ramlibacter sp.]